MATSRITIKDLAKRMNFSVSTISRALHDHPSIGKKTTREVKKLAKELGYFPNSVASNLRRNKTTSIGVIVPRIDIHFHSLAISGIEEVAYKSGYTVTIYQSRDSLEREVSITNILQTNMVDGIIICLGLETKDCKHFTRFRELSVPLVFYDRVSDDFEASKVIIDDFEAAFKATEHLILRGCTKIAHIAGCQSMNIFKARKEGYKAALTKHNLEVDDSLIEYTTELSYDEGVECAKKLLSGKVRPDGIFCANDYTAISSIQVFTKAGFHVPNDIAVVGFSNYPISKIIEPTLTTIDDQAFEMGQTAAKLLIRQIEEKDHVIASETIVIKTELVIRDSTRTS
ncbi:LacI family DNA-binding transcriptional regulator [Labilibaculum euxinus]|uniref:Substrate-binding domain-containing protein n=1 Tax=Labilibaculum euxinus TaxID=2686357 RepID=A0A7M4D969_9BACT|nr:LacI family DNA-binding transcriptional regulator [Labilibaculum euxinus]MUP39198.1 substrate-binding domain-containing protein [Labilibaculum euxinus]MVB08403.1 substrate-binding domain-containing protein [Labilibaculum euxinus]